MVDKWNDVDAEGSTIARFNDVMSRLYLTPGFVDGSQAETDGFPIVIVPSEGYPLTGAAALNEEHYEVDDDFVDEVKQQRSSVQVKFSEAPLLIDTIFFLLVEMIRVLQNTAAVKAKRLEFLTTVQREYAGLMEEIQPFVQGGDTPAFISEGGTEGTGQQAGNARGDLNNINAGWLETLRARRTDWGDQAKKEQSNLNAATDAANQQANIATALLQQLSTILGAIFR